MEINEVRFVGSYERESQCPRGNMPEFAFIGRSNVGKSSLINMLTGRVNLARVSKQPGKTQLINFFNVDESWHLVDLPGYGYAKRSKKKRDAWEKMIERYLVTRQTLFTAFVLLDSRIPLQDIDLEFINWLGDRNVPFNIIYTKIDKLKKGERKKNTKRIEDGLLQYWNFLPQLFVSSAEKGTGRKDILNYIGSLMGQGEEE